jgi:hypothetical protein
MSKEWTRSSIYNFDIEFNRIETYNKYIKSCYGNFFPTTTSIKELLYSVVIKNDYTIEDIPDLQDYCRIKNNLNILCEVNQITEIEKLPLNYTNPYEYFNYQKANELEARLRANLDVIGNRQYSSNICGLLSCGQTMSNINGNMEQMKIILNN